MGAGELYAQAGANFGNSIADAINHYHQEHLRHDQALGEVDALSRILWTDKDTGKPVINPQLDESGKPVNKNLVSPFNTKVIDQYRVFNRNQAAQQIGGLDAIHRILGSVINDAIKGNPAADNIRLRESLIRSRPLTAKTQNPDLNFTHAVNAHNAQVGQIEDYFNNNYGVGPADILNSQAQKGYVFDPEKNTYVDAQKGQTPDAIGLNTGEGFKWLTSDQFNMLKPQAMAWQDLQNNPPKRSDYKTAAPNTGTSNADLINQANQIKANYLAGKMTRDEAAAAIKALNIPGLQ